MHLYALMRISLSAESHTIEMDTRSRICEGVRLTRDLDSIYDKGRMSEQSEMMTAIRTRESATEQKRSPPKWRGEYAMV